MFLVSVGFIGQFSKFVYTTVQDTIFWIPEVTQLWKLRAANGKPPERLKET